MVAALALPTTIGRDERHDVCLRLRNAVDDERCRIVRDPAQPALLPAGHQAAHRVVVRDGRSGLREAELAARAFAAALHGPCRRRPASFAPRRLDPRQAVTAGAAQVGAGRAANEAAPRQQNIQHSATLAAEV